MEELEETPKFYQINIDQTPDELPGDITEVLYEFGIIK